MKSWVTKLSAFGYKKRFRNHMISFKLLTDFTIDSIQYLRQRVNEDIGNYIL